jgi:hypothetical protein
VIRKPPPAHNARRHPHVSRDRVEWPSAANKTTRARLTSRCGVRGRGHRAQHPLAPPAGAGLSCFGNHPDLESRLTLQ